MPISRKNFIELCEKLTAQDEKQFEALWRSLGLSIDWSQTYHTIGEHPQRVARRRSCATWPVAKRIRRTLRVCGT